MMGALKLTDGTYVNVVSYHDMPADIANGPDCIVFQCDGTLADFNRALHELNPFTYAIRMDEDVIRAACQRVSES